MKKAFKYILLTLGILTLLNSYSLANKAMDYFELKKIEKENQNTLAEIKQSDIIKRNNIKADTTQSNTTPEVKGIKTELLERGTSDNGTAVVASIPPSTKPIEPPAQAYLEVQFICQAPLQTEKNWTLHEESCEEAALLMAYLYESGKTMTKEEANATILDMIQWQKDNFGGHYDIYADQVKELATGYYDIRPEKIEIIKNATIADVKQKIAEGYPVIVPITGEILKNPYYPYPGYHMLTVIGYTEDRIITNDNGTRRGADFSYDTKTFNTAMQDAGAEIVIIKDL